MKPVLFVSFRPLNRAENIKAIYDYYDGPKQFIITHDPNYKSEVESGKYDLMVIDEFPTITPGQCIMIWHAIQGGKHVGLDQPGHPYYNRSYADLITCIISAGTGAYGMWTSATGVPASRIFHYGLPCTDAYVGKHKGDGNTPLAKKNAYLYVPTFRDSGEPPEPTIDYDLLDSMLRDDELFVIKKHPWMFEHGNGYASYVSRSMNRYKHIIEIPGSEPSTPYLIDCDVVITDYSSILFDGYLLNKPCVLFDRNTDYVKARGMYFMYPYDYAVNEMATDEQSLISQCRALYSTDIPKGIRTTLDIVADRCDGHACKRMSRLINELNGGVQA